MSSQLWYKFNIKDIEKYKKCIKITEKPLKTNSKKAITGLYFFDGNVNKYSSKLKKSKRGELEIIDLIRIYLKNNSLTITELGRGSTWLDTGTHESLLKASQFIENAEKRQKLKIGCLEEIAFRKGFITLDKLLKNANKLKGTAYGEYLLELYLNNKTS